MLPWSSYYRKIWVDESIIVDDVMSKVFLYNISFSIYFFLYLSPPAVDLKPITFFQVLLFTSLF